MSTKLIDINEKIDDLIENNSSFLAGLFATVSLWCHVFVCICCEKVHVKTRFVRPVYLANHLNGICIELEVTQLVSSSVS